MTLPEWLNDNLFKWIANNGFAVVMAILLLGFAGSILALLRYVVIDAVRYFTVRLDQMSERQSNSTDRQTASVQRLSETMDRQGQLLGALAEGQRTAMVFLSHNMAEVVAHRAAVESPMIPEMPLPGSADHPRPTPGVVKAVDS